MRRTLKGFLQHYCIELSGIHTSSLRRLCYAAKDNARLVEPLFCLAAEEGKAAYLVKLSEGTWFHEEYERMAHYLREYGSVIEFLKSGNAPARYASVFEAFLAQGDVLAADRRMNGILRERISSVLKRGEVTRYKICKDLGLNVGNVYAYLAGDDTKVSNSTARKIYEYTTQNA